MQSLAFFLALFAATSQGKQLLGADGDVFKMKFSSIKNEAERFTQHARDVLNGEGPTFTLDIKDHSLAQGVGEDCGLQVLRGAFF